MSEHLHPLAGMAPHRGSRAIADELFRVIRYGSDVQAVAGGPREKDLQLF